MIYNTCERAEQIAALLNGPWNERDGTSARAVKTPDGWTVMRKVVWG